MSAEHLPDGWARVDVPWSDDCFQANDVHWRQVWLMRGRWKGSVGGFLLVADWPTAEEAIAAVDQVNAKMPGPGAVWFADGFR